MHWAVWTWHLWGCQGMTLGGTGWDEVQALCWVTWAAQLTVFVGGASMETPPRDRVTAVTQRWKGVTLHDCSHPALEGATLHDCSHPAWNGKGDISWDLPKTQNSDLWPCR
jgi:hypothetical protein